MSSMKKITKYWDFLLGIFVLLYGSFLLWQYFIAYPTYNFLFDSNSIFSKNFLSIILPFVLLFLVFVGMFLWQKTKITLVKIFLFLWLGLIGYLLFIGILQPQDVFVNQNIFLVFLKLLLTFGTMLISSFVFSLILIVSGKLFLNKLWKESIDKEIINIFLYFFIGLFIFSFLGLFLIKIGFFVLPVFVSIFIFILSFFWIEFKKLLNIFFVHKINLNFKYIILISLVLSVVILNFSQTFFPFSLGWDSSNHYLVTTKLLIEEGVLRGGIFPPFLEIIMAIFGKFVGLSGVQFLFIFWGSFLPFIFYLVARKFKVKEPLNILLSLSLFLLPAISFQLSKDLKLDIIYLELLLIILVYFRKRISILLLGFAPLIKLTAFLFFPIVILFLFIKYFKKGLKLFLFSVFWLVLPFSIWGGVNLINYGHLPSNISQWQNILLKGKTIQPQINFSKILSLKQNLVVSIKAISTKSTEIEKYSSTAFKEEVGRYSGNESNFFKKIWAIFTSPKIPILNKQYVDLGFLWILFLPIFIFSLYEGIKKKDEIFLLSLLAMEFFILWIFMTEGVAWYGLPFIAILFILLGKILTRYKELKITNLVIVFFVSISIFTGFLNVLSQVSINQLLTSLSWASTPTTENADRLASIYFDEELQVTNILNKDPKAIVFRVGTLVKFWLSNPDERTIEDPQLEIWRKLSYGKSNEMLFNILKKNKIKYILIDQGTISIETDQQGTLHKKYKNLLDFISFSKKDKKINILFFGKRIILIRLSI